MTERNPALWMQNRTDHTAEQERSLIHGLYLGKEGVMGQDDFKVVQRAAGVNMSVDVGPGRATVLGDDNAAQGTYAVWNDAAKNVTLAASHATNGRKDIIVARIKDAFYSGASNTFTLEVITGTPAGAADGSGASDPTIPNNCLPLARVTVVATATSIADAKITDLRNRVGTMSSCDIICTSTTRPTTPFVGMNIYETDTGKKLVYTSVALGWRPPWSTAWGLIGGNATASDTVVNNTTVNLANSFVAPVVLGRRYKISGSSRISIQSVTIVHYFINQSGVVLTPSFTDYTPGQTGTAIGNWNTIQFSTVFTAASTGNTTLWVTAWSAGGNATYTLGSSIFIEDIGPAANPV